MIGTDPRSPNPREPETAEDDPPGTLEEVAPDEPTDKPGYEEQYEETPPADALAEPRGKEKLCFHLFYSKP